MCLVCLIVLISCSDVAASIVADEPNAGLTAFVAELTSMCGLRWDGIAAVNSLDFRLSSSVFRCCFTALLHFVPSARLHVE